MSTLERLVIDHCEQMLLLVEPDTLRIAMANRAAENILGYSEEQLNGMTILDVESALQDVFYWEDVRSGQYASVESQEGLYLCADGTMLAASKTVRPVEFAGRPMLLVQARERNEEKRIEDDLARTTSQLRATLESTGNGILVIDWQGRIASMNRLFSAMWSLPDEMLRRQDDEAIFEFIFGRLVDGDADVARRRLREIVESKETEDLLQLKDGRVFQCKSLPQYLEERITGRVFGFNDITERIRIEQDLIAARERAESANQAKAAFLAMMSHEIRTPMNGVMGVTSLMMDTPLNAEQKRYLDIIQASSESLLSIINDILDFSKIEARKLSLEAIDFDLLALFEDLADLNSLRAEQKGLEFACQLAPDVPTLVHGDPGRLRQILTNLIGNALKFTTSGTIALRVVRVPENGENIVLRIEVEDSGIGIAAGDLDKVFVPFEQADSSTTRKYGGTGLGLAICKQLAELMNGRIQVSSVLGQGTTFTCEVSLAPQRQPAPEPSRVAVMAGELRGCRVLVIDDNRAVLGGLTTLLDSWGLAVEGCMDAQEALKRIGEARAQGRPFDCLLVDQTLPDNDDGAALARSVRADPGYAELALVICVAAGYRGDSGHFTALGYADCLHKPVRRAALLDCLLRIAKRAPELPAPVVAAAAAPSVARTPSEKQLLVVEDNAVNMIVIVGLLKKLGYQYIDKAVHGQEAVEKATTKPYDLIIMDCQMPRMDGYEATISLREAGIDTPVVAMTANALSGDREKCLECGMNDYLAKPIAIDKLSEALSRWLRDDGTAA